MANMSYCRFENTYNDLQDCFDHMSDDNLSETEKEYRDNLVELCTEISREFDVE